MWTKRLNPQRKVSNSAPSVRFLRFLGRARGGLSGDHARVVVLFLSFLVASCGEIPRTLGVLTNAINVTERRVGPAPANVASSEFESPDSTIDFRRFKTADVNGDGTAERLVELPNGGGVQIRAENGQVVREITTDEYLTDFGTIGGNVVLYTYPNKERGGTFQVVTSQGVELARWQEKPPPGRFDVAEWNGGEAIVYLQGDTVVVRSAAGDELGRLSAPEGGIFRSVYLEPGARGTTIVLASGDGYTAFHMVGIYDQKGDLRYQEIAKEHAFSLEADRSEPRFQVVTRNSIVEYRYEP